MRQDQLKEQDNTEVLPLNNESHDSSESNES